jgi:hypothetical protein
MRNEGPIMSTMATMNRGLKQKRDKRNQQTEGTYRYKVCHGFGLPGLHRYITERTRDLLKQREVVGAQLKEAEVEVEKIQKEYMNES